MSGLAGLTAAETRRRVAAREDSCEEVTRAHLDRIAAVEPGIDASLLVASERALEAARRLDAALAAGEGPFWSFASFGEWSVRWWQQV